MKILLSLLILFSLVHRAELWNCRNLACYLKEGRTLTSGTLLNWKFRTCGSIGGISCSRANDRVPSRCDRDLNDASLQLQICNKKASSIPQWPGKLTIKVTKMGKADCKSNDANNFWMDKDGHGVPRQRSICCTKYRQFPWEPLKVHALPCYGTSSGTSSGTRSTSGTSSGGGSRSGGTRSEGSGRVGPRGEVSRSGSSSGNERLQNKLPISEQLL